MSRSIGYVWISQCVAVVLLVLGAVGFLGGVFVGICQPTWISPATQMPLGGLGSIVVDKRGDIYCGLEFYSRIQVYDAQGRFLRGWWVDGGAGGTWRLQLTDDGLLEVEAGRRGRIHIFDGNGVLCEQSKQSESQRESVNDRNQFVAMDTSGGRYTIRNRILCPRVVRDAHNEQSTIIATPWYLWPIMGPLPAWGFFMCGLVALGILKVVKMGMLARIVYSDRKSYEYTEGVKEGR